MYVENNDKIRFTGIFTDGSLFRYILGTFTLDCKISARGALQDCARTAPAVCREREQEMTQTDTHLCVRNRQTDKQRERER